MARGLSRKVLSVTGLMLLLAGCSGAQAPKAARLASPRQTDAMPQSPAIESTSPESLPADALRWYVSWRCVANLKPINETISFRIAEDHVDVLYEDGDADRFDVHLAMHKQDDWRVFTGKFEVGKALWMTDGYVIVQSPHLPPKMQKRYDGEKDLKSIYRRITFFEQPDGMAVSILPSSSTGDHSNFGRLDCSLAPVPKDDSIRFDKALDFANGPTACIQASECCRALRAKHHAPAESDTDEICDSAADISPRYCRSWYGYTTRNAQWGVQSECSPAHDGGMLCTFGERPKKPRPLPSECPVTNPPEASASR